MNAPAYLLHDEARVFLHRHVTIEAANGYELHRSASCASED